MEAGIAIDPLQFEIVPAGVPEGDFNQDGTVDAADYVVWRKGLGTDYTQEEYDRWRANFGKTAGSGAALPSAQPLSAPTPEPASVLLLIFGTSFGAFFRVFKLHRYDSAHQRPANI